MCELNGRTALVTGTFASQGIGRAISVGLAKAGARVILSDIGDDVRMSAMQAAVAQITAQGGNAQVIGLDVSNESEVHRVVETLGALDILVNNAATLAGSADFLSTTAAEWETSFGSISWGQ